VSHISREHQESTITLPLCDDGRYICPFDRRLFSTEKALRGHWRTCTGVARKKGVGEDVMEERQL
jgi:hypothetical protein